MPLNAVTTAPTCARCGTFLGDPRSWSYSDRGEKLCASCFERADIELTTMRQMRTVRSAGYTGPMLVFASFLAMLLFGIFGLLVMAIGGFISFGALVSLRDEEIRKRLGMHMPLVALFSGGAVLVSLGIGLLMFLGLGLGALAGLLGRH